MSFLVIINNNYNRALSNHIPIVKHASANLRSKLSVYAVSAGKSILPMGTICTDLLSHSPFFDESEANSLLVCSREVAARYRSKVNVTCVELHEAR